MNSICRNLFCSTIFLAASLSAQNYPAKKPATSPPPSNSGTPCPWLTEGSVANVLGGQVSVIVNLASPTQGTCTFVKTAHPQDQLKVFVGTEKVPACPAGSAHVVGIGDQAIRCHLPIATHGSTQMISGNVRTVNLAVTLSDTSRSGKQSDGAIEQIAEQVAGNLF
jgi:hypothetical protein